MLRGVRRGLGSGIRWGDSWGQAGICVTATRCVPWEAGRPSPCSQDAENDVQDAGPRELERREMLGGCLPAHRQDDPARETIQSAGAPVRAPPVLLELRRLPASLPRRGRHKAPAPAPVLLELRRLKCASACRAGA